MKPTTDELIRIYYEAMGNSNLLEAFWKGRLQGRLDVLEEINFNRGLIEDGKFSEEIAKLKEVLK